MQVKLNQNRVLAIEALQLIVSFIDLRTRSLCLSHQAHRVLDFMLLGSYLDSIRRLSSLSPTAPSIHQRYCKCSPPFVVWCLAGVSSHRSSLCFRQSLMICSGLVTIVFLR